MPLGLGPDGDSALLGRELQRMSLLHARTPCGPERNTVHEEPRFAGGGVASARCAKTLVRLDHLRRTRDRLVVSETERSCRLTSSSRPFGAWWIPVSPRVARLFRHGVNKYYAAKELAGTEGNRGYGVGSFPHQP